MIWAYVLCAVVFATVFLLVRNRRAIEVSGKEGWTWMFSKGMEKPQVDGDTLTFRIGPSDQAQYLINFDANKPYTRLSVRTERLPIPIRGGEPTASLFFIAKGDDWQGEEFKRWWTRARCEPNGSITASMDPADWRTISAAKTGDKYPEEFAKALREIEGAGVTFGGTKGGAGKGWRGSGRVTLTLG